jgi:phosphoribosylformylglycinamidine cyclo-ligase
MTTYKDAGVDIQAGDRASRSAYEHAASTFASRKGMVGEPVLEHDGFGGLLNMGEYYLVQTDDGTGTKIDLAYEVGRFDTLGYDLLAMVVDDAVCTGAEVISVSNCIDVPKVEPQIIDALLKGLAEACTVQRVVIPAGEIAEVPGAVTRAVWSATAVGVVAKDRVMQPKTIKPGDAVITLRDSVARSNGFSLVRKILSDTHGKEWCNMEWRNGTTWGQILLTPSVIYHAAILSLIGRYGEKRAVDVKGIAHITGGGIPSKFRRILKATGFGATLTDLWEPHDAMKDLIALGSVQTEEAYRTWNMGNGMMIVVDERNVDESIALLKTQGIEAKRAGTITKDPTIVISAWDGAELRV